MSKRRDTRLKLPDLPEAVAEEAEIMEAAGIQLSPQTGLKQIPKSGWAYLKFKSRSLLESMEGIVDWVTDR